MKNVLLHFYNTQFHSLQHLNENDVFKCTSHLIYNLNGKRFHNVKVRRIEKSDFLYKDKYFYKQKLPFEDMKNDLLSQNK